MHPLTHTRPKVMLPLANRPILEHLLLSCRDAGLNDIIIVTGYCADIVKDYFADGKRLGLDIRYIDQKEQLGTADAVRQVKGLTSGRFLLLNGDILVNPADLSRIATRPEMCMGVFQLDDVRHLGVVEVENNKVLRIHEKVGRPPTNLVNAGVYLMTEDIFQAVEKTSKSRRGEYELTASLQLLINQGYHIHAEALSYWEDISYPWQLLDINEKLMKNLKEDRLGTIEPGVVVKGKLSVGKDTVIKSGTYIEGPFIVGEGCKIGPNCYIRGSTAIGNECHVGASVEIKNSIIMNRSNIPHHNYVGDSIIGEDCNLGAGTKIANLRLDKGNIQIKGIETGRRKMGAIIGDRVQTGINVSINIGTLIGNDSNIGPGVFVSGIIPPHSALLPQKTRPKASHHRP